MADIDVYLKPNVNEQKTNLLGRLIKNARKHVFSYQLGANEALSLTMPVRTESYNFDDLHPVFQMNLPEGVLRQAIERATAKTYGSDDLTMLALLGSNQIGRIAYAIAEQPLIKQNTITPDLATLLSNDDAALFGQLLTQFATSSGVAGVQPKVLLNLKSKATLPLQSYIVKGWGNEYPELGCNEMVCLTLAKNAGLSVPEFYLSDNAKLLVSKRFDIVAQNTSISTNSSSKGNNNTVPSYEVLGFEDFCVLQGKTTREKYDASLESCTHTIRQFVSPIHQQKSLYDFFKLTLVNILIRNGDAHLKNNGVIYPHLQNYKAGSLPLSERKLAPMFDIVSTVPYLPNDKMALSLTGSKRWPKWKVIEQFGKQHCGLNSKKINHAYDEVIAASEKTMPLLENLVKAHPLFEPVAGIMGTLMKKSL